MQDHLRNALRDADRRSAEARSATPSHSKGVPRSVMGPAVGFPAPSGPIDAPAGREGHAQVRVGVKSGKSKAIMGTLSEMFTKAAHEDYIACGVFGETTVQREYEFLKYNGEPAEPDAEPDAVRYTTTMGTRTVSEIVSSEEFCHMRDSIHEAFVETLKKIQERKLLASIAGSSVGPVAGDSAPITREHFQKMMENLQASERFANDTSWPPFEYASTPQRKGPRA